MELRNYRDHFRRKHQNIPYAEFIENVSRNDPKWLCHICNKQISLGNVARHQAICTEEHSDDTNETKDTDDNKDTDEDELTGNETDDMEDDPNFGNQGKATSSKCMSSTIKNKK